MKFGIRQCANIVFRAKQVTTIGTKTFHVGQPVLYIDTATTSTLEQATSTTYAQGGRGNSRLIAWQGDKTLTFTVTDALISPVSLSMLSGAGLVKGKQRIHMHATTAAVMEVTSSGEAGSETYTGVIDLTDALRSFGYISADGQGTDGGIDVDAGANAPLFIMDVEQDGSITGDLVTSATDITYTVSNGRAILTVTSPKVNGTTPITQSRNILVDYYINKNGQNISEIQLTPQDFAGYYYVEADTLFRDQARGIDMPANLTFPNVKVQSGFTITMAGTGDPSTFDFTMDAFPGYTYFNKNKKVLCVIQVVEDSNEGMASAQTVMPSTETYHEASGSLSQVYVTEDSDMASTQTGDRLVI